MATSRIHHKRIPPTAAVLDEEICFRVVCEVVRDGKAYYGTVRGLPVHVSGATKDEAAENALRGAACHILSLVKHGEPVPLPIVKRGSKPETTETKATKSRESVYRRSESLCVHVGRPALT